MPTRYTVTDHAETLEFADIHKLRQYLAETCTVDYALEVFEWALVLASPKLVMPAGAYGEPDTWEKKD